MSHPSYPASPPPDEESYQTENVAEEGSVEEGEISILDPRRFTPTLHASLVSEILSLRRELDSKHRFIDNLETGLQVAKSENESLVKKLSESAKESRLAKQQLQRLDTDTRRALDELERERTQASVTTADLRTKVESLEKKIRSQEDDSGRTHNLWERDRENWEGEKLSLERRIHVTESRLKIVLTEFAALQAATQSNDPYPEGDASGNPADLTNGVGSETASLKSHGRKGSYPYNVRHGRSMSNNSLHKNIRSSIFGGPGLNGNGGMNGLSLADELNFDEDEEDMDLFGDDDDDYSEHELRARRALESRQSVRQDEKAKRVLGLTGPGQELQISSTEPHDNAEGLERVERPEQSVVNRTVTYEYVDTGVQFSPPPSPKLSPKPMVPEKDPEPIQIQQDVEANQRRKRVSAGPLAHIFSQHVGVAPKTPPSNVSVSSQTTTQPLSPPATPATPATPKTLVLETIPPVPVPPKPEVTSVSTQTDPPPEQAAPIPPKSPLRPTTPLSIAIPTIAIHPPLSAPSSPKQAVLPPRTKNAICQTDLRSSGLTRSASVQTEEIRIDQRRVKLPAHLLPSALSSGPIRDELRDGVKSADHEKTSEPTAERLLSEQMQTSIKTQPLEESKTITASTENHYPGNNDNGPLSRDKQSRIRRPLRSSSLFAGFDEESSGGEEGLDDVRSSDDWDRSPTATKAPPLPIKISRTAALFSNPPTPVPEESPSSVDKERKGSDGFEKSDVLVDSSEQPRQRTSLERRARIVKPSNVMTAYKQSNVRRSALIQSGNVAHLRQHSSTPSIGSGSTNDSSGIMLPPFPVPTRLSSRKVNQSKSEGAQSPTPGSGGIFSGRRAQLGKQLSRRDSLRKVRSAAVINRPGRSDYRPSSPSTPSSALSPRSPTPQPPPIPKDMITSAHYVYTASKTPSRPQLSRTTSCTGSTSVGSSGNQSSVVDAIAMTMVGEWMWKYVRRGKSFGVPESPHELGGEPITDMTGNGVRHKRWVWLSPYERTVMWSSKQPISGSALMGKSGRKLPIQSVLDVKDDTPLPRSASSEPIFNRSILILTPARALKFTAVSSERHYVWLTALSFLAHSAQGVPELPQIPRVPQHEPEPPRRPTGASLRRAPIRDSVRLAKDRSRPDTLLKSAPYSEPIIESYFDPKVGAPVPDAASPPNVPRFAHGRKRSTTGPRLPAPGIGFRSFSHTNVTSSNYSVPFVDHNHPPSLPSSIYNANSVGAGSSRRTSVASGSVHGTNFFEAIGTVRMEAFIEPRLSNDSSQALPGLPRPRHERRKESSRLAEQYRIAAVYDDSIDMRNPFQGF